MLLAGRVEWKSTFLADQSVLLSGKPAWRYKTAVTLRYYANDIFSAYSQYQVKQPLSSQCAAVFAAHELFAPHHERAV